MKKSQMIHDFFGVLSREIAALDFLGKKGYEMKAWEGTLHVIREPKGLESVLNFPLI